MSSDQVKKLQQSLSIMTSKYEALKAEHGKFAYIIAHDMGTPLRHVRDFNDMLLEELAPVLKERDRQLAEILNKNVDKAERMLDALLQYATLTTKIAPFELFDMNALVSDSLKTFQTQFDRTNAVVTVSHLPDLYGDANQIRLLVSHLIENAIKFTNSDCPLNLDISGQLQDGHASITIRDNGMGVPQDHWEIIFEIFRRYHVDENPGLGVGLALCKQIAILHNGVISVHSNFSNETAFTLSLPVKV